jgi:hypothetical protein
MTTMTITPAPAAGRTLADLREAVEAARQARRQRHVNDVARALGETKNPNLVADYTGLPLCFVLRVAARLGVIDPDDPDDTSGLSAAAPLTGRARDLLTPAVTP